MNQKGLLIAQKGEGANPTPRTQEAPLMRLKIATLRRVVKADLPIEFVPQQLTSYGGLELLRRHFRLLGLHRRVRQAFSGYGLGGDYGAGRLVILVIGLFVVGARRLEHLRYLAHDPLVARLCGLARIPTDRTVVSRVEDWRGAGRLPLAVSAVSGFVPV
jgi:hypothetical protein